MSATEDLVRNVIVGSPFGTLVGVEPEAIERDRVRLRLRFRPEVTTVGDVVHGGAIASLVDVAATAAVWSGADLERSQRGTTVGFAGDGGAGGDPLEEREGVGELAAGGAEPGEPEEGPRMARVQTERPVEGSLGRGGFSGSGGGLALAREAVGLRRQHGGEELTDGRLGLRADELRHG